jgi:hypothetical protein
LYIERFSYVLRYYDPSPSIYDLRHSHNMMWEIIKIFPSDPPQLLKIRIHHSDHITKIDMLECSGAGYPHLKYQRSNRWTWTREMCGAS